MPSQRAPRYPLRSHDLPMSSDLFASHKYSASSQSRITDDGSKSAMPSLVDRSENAMINYQYNDNSYLEDGPFANPKTLFGWQDLHDPNLLFQHPHQSRASNNYSGSKLEGAYGASPVVSCVDQNLWDYDALQGTPELTYASSIYTRAFSSREEPNTKDLMQSKPQTHPMSSVTGEPQHRQLHQTHCHFQRATRNFLTVSPREMPPSQLGEKSYGHGISILEDVKVESPDSDELSTIEVPIDDSPCTIMIDNSPCTVMPDDSPCPVMNHDESDADSSVAAEPYAQLICRALKSVPGHGMVLKEIYDWFEKNTDKAKNASSKGWQNSIRHNLSMNGAFKKVEQTAPTEESKKGFIWVLEQSALEEGVKSTTRYRKHSSNKKAIKNETPASQRQRSGSKGGKAARKAAKSRRSARLDELKSFQYHETLPIHLRSASAIGDHDHTTNTFSSPERMPYYLHTPHPPTTPLIPEDMSYTFSDITGCASGSPNDPLFYETLDTGTSSMLSCHSFCDSENGLLNCGLGCME